MLVAAALGLALTLVAGCAQDRPPPPPPSPSSATRAPDGRVGISLTGIALGVGYEWGRGTLAYRGQNYPFRVQGLSIIDIGISEVSAQGEVFDLRNVNDFAGTYTDFEAGATLIGGGAVNWMKNEKGVVIRVTSVSQGARLTLAPGGTRIELTR
jgi:hypothetical protein